MKVRLLDWLVCPWCADAFHVECFARLEDTGEVVDGLLRCRCGEVYPIVDTIPRILDDAFGLFPAFTRRYGPRVPAPAPVAARTSHADAIRQTRDAFGYQWTTFAEMVDDFRENFLHYIQPLDESFFPGKVGLDLGCGFGRHLYNAARFGAEMVGVDISAAIDATRRNTRHLPNVHLVQADIYRLPFAPERFDFAYSIGVLHHLPDPEAGFRCLIQPVKPGGAVFVWVYSTQRRITNFLLECVRAATVRLPRGVQKLLALAAASVDWAGFITPYRLASALPRVGPLMRRISPPRLALYSVYPFQVVWADWFDRLAAPIRFYYDAQDLEGWLRQAKLERTRVSPTGLFGWRAYGERP